MQPGFRNAPLFTAASFLAISLTGCVEQDTLKASDLGPMSYDASGTMQCSAGAPSFDQACGWRVVRRPGGAEIWISNIAVRDRPAYRVLNFSGGEFTTRDGAPLQVSKEGDTWTVSANGNEHYRFADALITGGCPLCLRLTNNPRQEIIP